MYKIKDLLLHIVGNYAEKLLCLKSYMKNFKFLKRIEYIGLYRVIYI